MPDTRWCLRSVAVVALVVFAALGLAGPAAALDTSTTPTDEIGPPPGIPTSVSVTAGDGRVVVSWVAPVDEGGSTISSYTVTAHPGEQTAKVPGVARSATVLGLSNGVAYRFTVVASNHAGPGPPSAVSSAVTPSVATRPAGPRLLSEDFSTGPGGMEAISGGTWGVASGRYVLSAPADHGLWVPNSNLAVHRTVVTGDFVLSALAATTPTASLFNDFSIVFGYQDPTNYYFASFSEGNDVNTSGIFKVWRGTRTQLADIFGPIVAGRQYTIRVERVGAVIRVFRGDERVAEVSDTTFTSGRVGFGSRNDGGTFDDLLVTRPPPPPPPPPAPPGFLTRAWAWVKSLFAG
jgi:hypothetical protein